MRNRTVRRRLGSQRSTTELRPQSNECYRSQLFFGQVGRDRRRGLNADGPYHVGVKAIDLGVNRPLRDASTIAAP